MRVLETLSRGGWANPDVCLAEEDGERFVVKDYQPRRAWVRWTWGVWMTRRELRAYRVLQGLSAVPKLRSSSSPYAFTLEYRPGERLSRALAPTLAPEFIDQLRAAILAMHERGVVHLDLRHRSNVLAGRDGEPVLIDFASAICFRPGGIFSRCLLPWLARIDLGALRKWEVRLRP